MGGGASPSCGGNPLGTFFFSLFSDGLSTRIVRLESSGDSPGVFVLEAD